MKLKPMADNVLLKQHEAAETTVSGIILATTSKESPRSMRSFPQAHIAIDAKHPLSLCRQGSGNTSA